MTFVMRVGPAFLRDILKNWYGLFVVYHMVSLVTGKTLAGSLPQTVRHRGTVRFQLSK